MFNGKVDINFIRMGNNIALCYIGGFAGSVMVILAAMLAPPLGGILRLLAENTITILALHGTATGVCLKIYSLMIGTDTIGMTVSLPVAAVVSAIVLALCTVPAYIIRHWLPFMLGAK